MTDYRNALRDLSERGVPSGAAAMTARLLASRGDEPVRTRRGRSTLVSGLAAAIGVMALAVAAALLIPNVDLGDGGDGANRPIRGEPGSYAVGGEGLNPTYLALSDDSVWTTGPVTPQGQPQPVVRTDRRRGEQTARISLPDEAASLAVAPDGTVWVVTLRESGDPPYGAVLRIDPGANAISGSLPLESPGRLAIGEGSVWVTDPRTSQLYRIDPGGPSLSATIDVPGGAADVVTVNGSVWVSGPFGNTVSQIDPATNTITRTVAVGEVPGFLAATGDRIWVANGRSQSLTGINLDDGRVDATIALPSQALGLSASPTTVWTIGRNGTQGGQVLSIEGSTGTVAHTPGAEGIEAIDLELHGGALWVLDASTQTVQRLPA